MLNSQTNCARPGTEPTGAAQMRAALILQYITIGYNVLEGVVCVIAGGVTGVLSILAFGIDSFIEVLASVIMVRLLRFRGSTEDLHRAELRARRGIGISFFILAAYILFESGRNLYAQEPPDQSTFALIIAAASAVAMPILGRVKRNLARRMNMASLASEAAQTTLCGWLSIILLLTVGVYRITGWWWVDAVGAIAMTPIIVVEGLKSLQGKSCNCS